MNNLDVMRCVIRHCCAWCHENQSNNKSRALQRLVWQ